MNVKIDPKGGPGGVWEWSAADLRVLGRCGEILG